MNKDFEEKFCRCRTITEETEYFDKFFSDVKPSEVWQWIEQYAKQQRIDELWRMQNKLYGVTDMQGVKDEFENRIKEIEK